MSTKYNVYQTLNIGINNIFLYEFSTSMDKNPFVQVKERPWEVKNLDQKHLIFRIL